jgi:glycosyltransferase involved in cell wall biosynthesis
MFNEAGSVEQVVQECLDRLRSRSIDAFEMILVDDGSVDGTTEILKAYPARDPRIRCVHHQTNRGLGAALQTGFSNCLGEIILWVPGDGQFDLGDVLDQVPRMKDLDILVALRQGVRQTWRSAISWSLCLVVRVLFSFDANNICGIYIIRRATLEEIKPQSQDVFLNLEIPILCLRHHKRMSRFVIGLKPRLAGQSKVANARTMTRNFIEMIKVRYGLRRRK